MRRRGFTLLKATFKCFGWLFDPKHRPAGCFGRLFDPKHRQRAFTLLELTFSMGLGLIVLAVGYSAYFNVVRADDVERRREALATTALEAMNTIKQDVRAAGLVAPLGNTLVLNTTDRRITYRPMPRSTGILRLTSHGRREFKGVKASFSGSDGGVNITIQANERIHGRVIRVDLDCFVTPRNR